MVSWCKKNIEFGSRYFNILQQIRERIVYPKVKVDVVIKNKLHRFLIKWIDENDCSISLFKKIVVKE